MTMSENDAELQFLVQKFFRRAKLGDPKQQGRRGEDKVREGGEGMEGGEGRREEGSGVERRV
jgi:hypothetical protein